jgi:hypothetical protein
MSVYKTVEKFETFDHVWFDSFKEAENHVSNKLRELFATQLEAILPELGQAAKYKIVCALVSDDIEEAIALCKAQAQILGLEVSERWPAD